MPEVVEVELQAQGLKKIIGDQIEKVFFEERGETLIRPMDGDTFASKLEGRTIKNIRRIGKYIAIELDNYEYLVSHLAMTGSWLLNIDKGHTRINFRLKSGRTLRFNDTRFFARLYIEDDSKLIQREKGLDVFNATYGEIYDVLQKNIGKSTNLKKLLLNQKILSGLGNVYVNETLFEAGLFPGKTLSRDILHKLVVSMQNTVARGYSYGGLSMKDYFHVDGSRGTAQEHLEVYKKSHCSRCGTPIVRTEEFDKRATFYCPVCQPE